MNTRKRLPLLPRAPRPAAIVPDLDSYDIIELSSSGGKDSQAMIFHVAKLLRERSLLERGVVAHADLGRVEWRETVDVAAAQANLAGLPFVMRSRKQGDLLEHIVELGKFPTPTQRFCTADHKRQQLLAIMTDLAKAHRQQRGLRPSAPVRILNCVGLRAEESPARDHAQPFKPNARGTSSRKIIDMWLPVHHWTLAEVWQEVHESGAPIHPAYAAGFPRASCRLCIYMNRKAVARAAKLHPELAAEYAAAEAKTGHRFRKDFSIAEVIADVEAGRAGDEPVPPWLM